MGVSIKYVFVFNDNVFEIPLKQINESRFVKSELSNQTGLMMEIACHIKDRKPYEIAIIVFERISIDENGVYDFEKKHFSEENSIKLEYVFAGLYSDGKPLPIPIAPAIPTDKEVEIIKTHLNKKYLSLLLNSPHAITDNILRSKRVHEENIVKMKQSHKKKG